jgi:type IV secretory pathway VirB10-like protein
MDNQLLLGVILIVVGIALALLAYAFILNRREQDQGAPAEPPEKVEAAERPPAPVPYVPPPAAAAPAPAPAAPPAGMPAAPTVTPLPIAAAPPAPTPAPAPLQSRRTLAVATLLRDEVTGKISVLVGGREYTSVDELRASRDFTRVEYAAADLVEWLGVAAVRERASERTKDEVKKPVSMVEQIDAILQRKMAETSGGPRGVRLVEGSDGSIRVFLGVQGYAFEDVPDDGVKRMIREAVAEWEAKK